jgi:hypothetical protein
VYFYFVDNAHAPATSETTESETTTTEAVSVLPEGVSVVEKNGERILRDERVGYEIRVNNEDIKNLDGDILLFNSNIDKPFSDLAIFILDNQKKLNADQWILKYHEDNFLLYFDSREKIITNSGIEGYKVKEEGDPDHFSYHMVLGDKVLMIDTPYPEKYESLIKDIGFIQGGYVNKTN